MGLEITEAEGEMAAVPENSRWHALRFLKSPALAFAVAFFLTPVVILLHECGHYIVHYFQGHRPVIYSSMIWPASISPTFAGQLLGAVAGPVVEASLCVIGFLWLRWRRRGRLQSEPTGLDWLATFMALCCGRWIHHTPDVIWGRYRTGRYGSDEAGISMLLGLPGWVVPVALFFPAVCVLVATVRKHPRARRLVPFSAMVLGGGSGGLLWCLVVGPSLFGQQPAPFRLWQKVIVPPKVVALVPANGATNVNPSLTEIRVTFDRPMRDNSWAYCGDGPHFPGGTDRPHYDETRTVWSVPVKLKPDWEYVFQLNSEQYQSFVSEEGAALGPVLVRFRTAREGRGTER